MKWKPETRIHHLPNRIFITYSPRSKLSIKRKVDHRDAMKYAWATEKGSQRTGVELKGDVQVHSYSRMCSVPKV